MNFEELEEALEDLLGPGYHITTHKTGQLIVYTGLRMDDDGEVVDMNSEEDTEVDPDFEPLEEDEDDD